MQNEKNHLIATLKKEGITNPLVLQAIADVPRENFVAPNTQESAYENRALPLGCGQTISQPYVVARMTSVILNDRPLNNVLEIGTGSGYQAAVLSKIATNVYTIERIRELYEQSKGKLADYRNIQVRCGDGRLGWAEQAPFDAIVVTAASPDVPPELQAQLADGGRLIIPIGDEFGQELQLYTREGNTFTLQYLDPVIFVPLLSGTEE